MFISFEGIEGSGKTTQANLLYEALGRDNTILTHEPGGTPVGDQVRQIFLDNEVLPVAELMLITAARVHHVEEVIRPALKKGKTVICDRFTDSTIAYQGFRAGLDIGMIIDLNEIATQGLFPFRTFLLDLPPEVALQRKTDKNRIDRESLEIHQKVRDGYISMAENDSIRFTVLDAMQQPVDIHETILEYFRSYHRED